MKADRVKLPRDVRYMAGVFTVVSCAALGYAFFDHPWIACGGCLALAIALTLLVRHTFRAGRKHEKLLTLAAVERARALRAVMRKQLN